MSASARLAELGIELPDVVPPVASYAPAVQWGTLIYTSGQVPLVSGALEHAGKVGEGEGLVSEADATAAARVAALNAVAAAASLAGGVDRIVRVVKVVGFVASDPTFTGQPRVINGASNVLQDIFGEAGVHARSAVGVAVLPLDAPVEVELIVEVSPT
ncbi:RidA family protein [Ruania halotolerans]|uniref:RidA family protein n=1 Tax=Ruania halotolerans TaxID=2897773 RepID=UPI001E4F9C7E|nr:RidA family protein [Ruania halotolerans]UFU07127.1 RidA family protein [Ruania halotolerans]